MRNFRESRWEPAALNGGKLCEVVYSVIHGHLVGAMPLKPQKPRNMVEACRALEQMAPTPIADRSVRIQIPRVLLAVYEVRNNRGVGHVGGDVDPNRMDATFVLYSSKWLLAELVRIFHGTTAAEATTLVDALVERVTPVVWDVEGRRRVLTPGLTMKEKTLLLLYHSERPVAETDLVAWVEHSNPYVYRRDVLRALHADRLVEYDEAAARVILSPTGSAAVEAKLL